MSKPRFYELIEDGAHLMSGDYDQPGPDVVQRSIAISLKRIADLMEPPRISADVLDRLSPEEINSLMRGAITRVAPKVDR